VADAIAREERHLDRDELRAVEARDERLHVAEVVGRAEAGFGYPVDVEFCFEGARLWLLQCRPVTAAGAA
jgi:phosphoenolpyruvate synthase/pyruvate phosphate dikinase